MLRLTRQKGGPAVLALAVAVTACRQSPPPSPQCDRGNGSLTLPAGFCASVFADNLGGARQIVVRSNGDVFVALQRGGAGPGQGGVVALRDRDQDGRADSTVFWGTEPGSSVMLDSAALALYFSTPSTVYRYALGYNELSPAGAPDTIVRGIPIDGHSTRSMARDDSGHLFVAVGSESNSCEAYGRSGGWRGTDPCTELEFRAGIWRFDARRTGQTQRDDERWATGIRNAVGLAFNPASHVLYATQHGRDGLYQRFPTLYNREQGAEAPSEELVRVTRGADFGWPYCFHDPVLRQLVLAPEYGGNGRARGRCADKREPVVAFPGHWAPDDLLFYARPQFPGHYRGGAFITFHGSWNRAPLPQAGYRVVFVPFSGDSVSGPFETFADGFHNRPWWRPGRQYRPVGLAQGPDGALFITEDEHGRIWRVIWTGSGAESRPD